MDLDFDLCAKNSCFGLYCCRGHCVLQTHVFFVFVLIFFYFCDAPGSNDRGQIVSNLSVCLSVCMMSTLTLTITIEP